MTFSDAVLELLIARLGMREATRNRGPEIDLYAISVGLDPTGMYPWCTDGQYYVARLAAKRLSLMNPFPRTASAIAFTKHVDASAFSPNPSVGAYYVLKHTPTEGHIGWVESCEGGNVLTEISGNTFQDRGGREGNSWARHSGQPEVTHGGELLGFWQLDALAQPQALVT